MTLSQRLFCGAFAVWALTLSSHVWAADKKAEPKPSTPPVDMAAEKEGDHPAREDSATARDAKGATLKEIVVPTGSRNLTGSPSDASQPPFTDYKEAAKKALEDKKPDNSLREQDIYIPYDKLRGVFEKHGRGVYMPYEKFQELWQAAQDKTRPAAAPRPPVGAVITEIENDAAVAKDVVKVTAHLKIDLLSEGWHEIPLRLADAAIVKATIKDQPARILGGVNEDHRLIVEHQGKEPEAIELVLEYAKAISRLPGQNSVSFQAPQAAVSRWQVRIPQSGVKVNIRPLIAATEVPPAPANPANKQPVDETVVLAFVGAAPTVDIGWTPKAEGATGLAALASVETEQVIRIQEGITRVATNVNYTISRAELGELALEVPADYKVVNVFDPNVRQWSVDPPAAGPQKIAVQKITVQLFEPAKSAQTVVIELEKIAGDKRQETLTAPVVKALNAGRQQGFVVVEAGEGLKAEAGKTTGLLQIDAGELPPALRGTTWTFAYRYAAVPYELAMTLEELQPRITVESLVEAALDPEKLSIKLTAYYNVERAGVFKLDLDVPEGFEIREVAGSPKTLPGIANYAAAEVESHHLEGEKKNHLVVNLSHKALGRVGLQVLLQRELHDANLVAPTGKTSEFDVVLPQPTPGTVEHFAGRLTVSAAESLRVNPVKADGLRPVAFSEAMEGMLLQLRSPGVQPILAFIFTQDPITLRLSADRRKPHVTVSQLLVARIEEGMVKYQDTIRYKVQYSGVKSLRIDVPADVALHNNTAGIHERTIDPPPADVEKGMVAWSFSGEGELLGDVQIELVWEKKLDTLKKGEPAHEDIPRLVPRDVDEAWGQIILAKAESLEFQEGDDLKGLRPIDPQRDLMSPVAGAARAFEFHDEWSLPVTVTRYDLADLPRTSIDRAVARMVITPAGETVVQMLYRVRSVRPRLAIELPPKAAPDSDPVRINGQPVMLQKGLKDALVVPLVNAGADEPLVLEVRYVIPAGEPLALPAFNDDAAVQKVYLCAFVPATQDVTLTGGAWSDDFQWVTGDDGRWLPHNTQTHFQHVAWVCEGNAAAADAARSFHFDGTPLVFSMLRPDAQSTVRLWTADHQTLSGWIFCLTLLGGLAIVRTSLRTRLAAIAGLIVALVALGIFWPTLSMQILGPAFWYAVTIVVIVWLVAAPFVYARQLRDFRQAAGDSWSAWNEHNRVARRKLPFAAAAPANPPPPASEEKGGASHE